MKRVLLDFLTPILSFGLKELLLYLKPAFLREDHLIKKVLRKQSFHSALCTHPSILFGFRKATEKRSLFSLNVLISFLKKNIRIGLLKSPRGQNVIYEIGIQPYFGNGVDFWFEESHSPIVPYHVPNTLKPKGKLVIYTALTGNYDHVHEILYKEDGVDYLLFTNNPAIKSKTWDVVFLDSDQDDLVLSREIKMIPHKYLDDKYDISIYIDANAVIYGELTELTRYLNDNTALAVSQHSVRKNLKEEIEACVQLKGVDRDEVEKQYARYVQEGFEDNRQLLECGILVRRHKDSKLQELMLLWFQEFRDGIKRDQLSLLPCISRLGYEDYTVMDGSVWHNQFCRIQSHNI